MDIDLSNYLSMKEACSALHRSDKQIRRYIKEGRLEAEIRYRQYFISKSSIEKLASQPIQLEDSLARQIRQLHSQIEAVSSRLDALANQLQRLSDELAELKKQPLPAPKPPRIDKATRQPPADLAEKDEGVIFVASAEDLPPDAIALYLVADSEGIKRHTLADFVRGRAMPHYGIRDPKRPREIARYVSEPQKQAILEAHRISRRPRKETR